MLFEVTQGQIFPKKVTIDEICILSMRLLIRLSEALNDKFIELYVKAYFNSKYVSSKKIRWKNLIYEKRLMPQGSCG